MFSGSSLARKRGGPAAWLGGGVHDPICRVVQYYAALRGIPAFPRYRVPVLHSPRMSREKNSMSENPTGGSPGMNHDAAMSARAAQS